MDNCPGVYEWDEAAQMKAARSETDWARLRYEAEHDIEPEADEESPEASEVMRAVIRRGRPKSPLTKEKISVRLDPDILAALRAGGPGWQSRMNVILRDALHLNTGPSRVRLD